MDTTKFWAGIGLLMSMILLLIGCNTAGEPSSSQSPATATPTKMPPPTLRAALARLDPTAEPDPSAPETDGEQPTNSDSGEIPTIAATAAPIEITVEPGNTAVPTASPTVPAAELPPEELYASAQRALELRDSDTAVLRFTQFLAADGRDERLDGAALFGLGRAEADRDNVGAAYVAFTAALDNGYTADHDAVHFWLAETAAEAQTAVGHYDDYLAANPEMGAYVYPAVAQRSPDNAEAAYLAALESDAEYRVLIGIRRQLADLYLTRGDYAATIAQYEAIRNAAQTTFTQGEMTYKIGSTLVLSGSTQAGYDEFLFGVNTHPRAYESYLGLVELVNAGIEVDPYQRGIVDYYAGAYLPGIDALQAHISRTAVISPPQTIPDAHLFLAWSYEEVGQNTAALNALDGYLAQNPADSDTIGTYYWEKAALETRSISVAQAVETLTEFADEYPQHPEVARARRRAGVLADRFMVNANLAVPLYVAFAEAHPQDENAAGAWLRVGVLRRQMGLLEEARAAWETAADYNDESARNALVWLLRTAEDPAPYVARINQIRVNDYYGIRARDLAQGEAAYDAPAGIDLAFDEAAGRAEVEAWIRAHFGLADEAAVSSELDPAIAEDARVVRGEKLWSIGEYEAAKQELEEVRQAYSGNAQLSYQLALYFRDLGLYRSSILAASSVLARAGVGVEGAPALIGRLAYPVYYADVIIPQAEQYGYDPLLQFALIRQESLYESFIASSAAAQGLMQIIPDTGDFVAQRLGWEGYQTADLYRPYLNLRFGSYYLDQQLEFFDQFEAAALAAYNGGPGNSMRWHEAAGDNHDLFLETVNFAETRTYIRSIYVGHTVYDYLYGVE